jgi:tRNA wybutosine-synthesizing protein 2
MQTQFFALEVPRPHVKAVKTALELKELRNREVKISRISSLGTEKTCGEAYFVPTLIEVDEQEEEEQNKSNVFQDLGISHLADDIHITTYGDPQLCQTSSSKKVGPLAEAVRRFVHDFDSTRLEELPTSTASLILALPHSYSIYPPLLLLPYNAFATPEWEHLLYLVMDNSDRCYFFQYLAEQMGVTHIAIDRPIPSHIPGSDTPNVQRRPRITNLYGDFGTHISTAKVTPSCFNKTLWVSTKQNGITQIWAPLYTMFSRGNVKEKTRLLRLPSTTLPPPEGAKGQCMIDMYAGIGYFAFSYIKAGLGKVLCFELNPWSVEGLRRGALANSWKCEVFTEDDVACLGPENERVRDAEVKLLVFHMDNQMAVQVIEKVGRGLPPIRHANLGLLPSSRDSWDSAVRILDQELGGWLHVHENLAEKDIQSKAGEIIQEIEGKLEEIARERGHKANAEDASSGVGIEKTMAKLEHVEKVKSYAPGVMHCVLDIHIKAVGVSV